MPAPIRYYHELPLLKKLLVLGHLGHLVQAFGGGVGGVAERLDEVVAEFSPS